MKIGILQAGHSPEELIDAHGDYGDRFEQLLAGHGFTFRIWSVVDMEFPDGPGDADAWLITGSRHGAYDDLPFIEPLEQLIRDIQAAGQRMVGVCFGHQIIAQALGGKVIKHPAGWSVGLTVYQTEDGPIALNAWHQDQVIERPEGARVLASSEFCENAILAYGDQFYTVQAHPEFGYDFVEGLARTRGKGVVPEPLLQAALAQKDVPTDRHEIGDRMAAWLKGGAQKEAAA